MKRCRDRFKLGLWVVHQQALVVRLSTALELGGHSLCVGEQI